MLGIIGDAKELFGRVWGPLGSLSSRLAANEIDVGGAEECLLESTAFIHGGTIPRKYTGEGENRSPALEWSGTTACDVAEWTLICEDPDALRPEPFVHWVIFSIPGRITWLPEGIPPERKPDLAFAATQTFNSKSTLGYTGPVPPLGSGPHHYHFQLFGTDGPLSFVQMPSKSQLIKALRGHVVAFGELVGTYERFGRRRN